jgi:hypothetical protein
LKLNERETDKEFLKKIDSKWWKTAPFCTTLGLLDTPVRMPTSLRYNFRRFLVEYSIKGNLTSVIAETFVFHHRLEGAYEIGKVC